MRKPHNLISFHKLRFLVFGQTESTLYISQIESVCKANKLCKILSFVSLSLHNSEVCIFIVQKSLNNNDNSEFSCCYLHINSKNEQSRKALSVLLLSIYNTNIALYSQTIIKANGCQCIRGKCGLR